MSHLVRLTLAVGLSAAALAPAQAQFTGFYTIGSDGVSLNNDDFKLLIDSANELLRRPNLAQGNRASWQSTQTGSHGTISVTDTFRHGAMPCHTLTYETNPMASASANTVKLNWCKTPDGWKILS
jgi:surface antigen